MVITLWSRGPIYSIHMSFGIHSWSYTYHVPLKYTCLIKINNQIRHVYLEMDEYKMLGFWMFIFLEFIWISFSLSKWQYMWCWNAHTTYLTWVVISQCSFAWNYGLKKTKTQPFKWFNFEMSNFLACSITVKPHAQLKFMLQCGFTQPMSKWLDQPA